jgi:hypothetical protein
LHVASWMAGRFASASSARSIGKRAVLEPAR